MADRFYGYQYGTSPRKLNYDYSQYRKSYPQDEEPVKTTNRKRSNTTKTTQNKRTTKTQQDKANNSRKKQVVKHNRIKKEANHGKDSKTSVKTRLKIVLYLLAGFLVLFAIGYQNSLINESFNKKEQLRKEMEALSKTNQQIEISIENNLNLNHIEQAAKEKIGMQKLSNSQKIYVSLPKEDYVAPAAEQVIIEEDTNFLQKLVRGFTHSIK